MEGSLAEGGEIFGILTELKPASQYAFVGKGFLKKGETAHQISGCSTILFTAASQRAAMVDYAGKLVMQDLMGAKGTF